MSFRQHHSPNGHESEQTLGDSEDQGSLACCSPWGRRVRYNLATEQQQKEELPVGSGSQGTKAVYRASPGAGVEVSS